MTRPRRSDRDFDCCPHDVGPEEDEMSNEEDREALARILNQHDPEGGSYLNDTEGNLDLSWWYPQVDAILAAGFHRTPAPASDVQTLIADARSRAESLRRMFPNDGEIWDDARLVERLTDAIEALVKERDQAIRDLDAGFAESDHLSAKYYQRMRAAEREMHARELHHFEEEQKSAGLAAEVERLRLVHAGQPRLALSAVFMADVDDDEGVQAFYREWVRNHDAALIESLAEARIPFSQAVSGSTDPKHVPTMHTRFAIDHVGRSWLRERARQVREGEA